MNTRPKAPPEALRFARWLEWGTRCGLVVMTASFVAYVAGWWPAAVPPHELARWWSLPLGEFVRQTQHPTGWQWLTRLHHADIAPLLGIAVLAGCAVPALLALLPLFHARGDRRYLLLCLAVSAVLLAAASGWLAGGH